MQRRVGERPWQRIRAYWFGRSFIGRKPIHAVEIHDSRSASAYHNTLYELPSARGRSSLVADAPRGEVQVVSQPRHERLARRTIEAINGRNGDQRYRPWPRRRIRLANRERAVVVASLLDGATPLRSAFFVITRTTLVSVSGGPFRVARIPALARRLRPLAP